MNFRNHVDRRLKHMACVRLEVIIGKGRMKVREGLTVLSSSEVTLERHKFAASLNRHPMVTVVIVHVPIDRCPGPADAAGDGGRIKTHLVGQ